MRAEMPLGRRRGLVLVNRISAIICLLAFLSIIINLLLGSYTFIPALSITVAVLLLTYFLNHKSFYTAARILMLVTVMELTFYMSLSGGYGSGLEFYFLGMITLPVFLFRNRSTIFFFQALCVACLVVQKFYGATHFPDTNTIPHKVFYVFNSIGSAILIALGVIFYRNITVQHEKELQQKNDIIGIKNTQLEASNDQLDAFTYSVSHDLRAPLRRMDGLSALLERKLGAELSDETKELLKMIRGSAFDMNKLIESLLTFSRSTKKELHPAEVDMNALVKEIVTDLAENIQKAGTTVKVEQLHPAWGDKDLICQVVVNLVSNAVKYSAKKEKPEVHIGEKKENEQVVYFVKDNGVGFDMKFSGRLFVPFQRLHDTGDYEGTGIGLSIVKNIIDRHGGNIRVESKEGEGTTFYFTLPAPTV
ncbi:MAG TPA: ATP-binding protein [Bacteroidia bacterium]